MHEHEHENANTSIQEKAHTRKAKVYQHTHVHIHKTRRIAGSRLMRLSTTWSSTRTCGASRLPRHPSSSGQIPQVRFTGFALLTCYFSWQTSREYEGVVYVCDACRMNHTRLFRPRSPRAWPLVCMHAYVSERLHIPVMLSLPLASSLPSLRPWAMASKDLAAFFQGLLIATDAGNIFPGSWLGG
jgi:hypothetical protein